MNRIEQTALGYLGKGKQEIVSRFPTDEWCAATVCCILTDLNINVYKSISCTQMANAWANESKMQRVQLDDVESGDVLFFDKFDSINGDCDHVAIVVEFDGDVKSGLYYVDGNGGKDGRTEVKKHYMSYTQLQTYAARIFRYIGDVPTQQQEQPVQLSEKYVTIDINQIVKGSQTKAVNALQALLVAHGYSIGAWGIDGDFGSDTLTAVKDFQRNHNLEADGIVGPLTWAALLK